MPDVRLPYEWAAPLRTARLVLRREAYFCEDLWFKGEWGDTAIYAILDREWAEQERHRSRRTGDTATNE